MQLQKEADGNYQSADYFSNDQETRYGGEISRPQGPQPMNDQQALFVRMTLDAWTERVNATGALLEKLTDDELMQQVAPGRNRGIYLMGHSMGGYGTWSVAMNHPDLFAALGPIAGGGNPSGMEKIKHIPQFIVHGDDDPTVNVSQSRSMVEAGRKAGATIEYIEVKGGGHGNVVIPNLGPMLDFFSKQSKP